MKKQIAKTENGREDQMIQDQDYQEMQQHQQNGQQYHEFFNCRNGWAKIRYDPDALTVASAPASQQQFIPKIVHKRSRTRYTYEQLEQLENEFLSTKYVTRVRLEQLIKELQLSRKQVKVWFQNRRIRAKKDAKAAAFNEIPTRADSLGTMSTGSSSPEVTFRTGQPGASYLPSPPPAAYQQQVSDTLTAQHSSYGLQSGLCQYGPQSFNMQNYHQLQYYMNTNTASHYSSNFQGNPMVNFNWNDNMTYGDYYGCEDFEALLKF